MVSVLITANVRLYRDSLAFVLAQDGRFRVTGSASTRDEIMCALRRERPAVVLLDLAVPGSARTLRHLARCAPGTAVVALVEGENEAGIISCAEAGAAGYLTRDAPLDELVDTILSAANGELRCPPSVAGSLFRRIGSLALGPAARARRPALTAREHEVLAAIDRGCSNKLIARQLGIEVATVKNHVHSILAKLGARGRGEAAAILRDDTGAEG